jgi:hypothetical protein
MCAPARAEVQDRYDSPPGKIRSEQRKREWEVMIDRSNMRD